MKFLRGLGLFTAKISAEDFEKEPDTRISLVKSITPTSSDISPSVSKLLQPANLEDRAELNTVSQPAPQPAVPILTQETASTIDKIAPATDDIAPNLNPFQYDPFKNITDKIAEQGEVVVSMPNLTIQEAGKNTPFAPNEPVKEVPFSVQLTQEDFQPILNNEIPNMNPFQNDPFQNFTDKIAEQGEVVVSMPNLTIQEAGKNTPFAPDEPLPEVPFTVTPTVEDFTPEAATELTTKIAETVSNNLNPVTQPETAYVPEVTVPFIDLEPAIPGITDSINKFFQETQSNPINQDDGFFDFLTNSGGKIVTRMQDDEGGGMAYDQSAEGGIKTAGMGTLGTLVLVGAGIALLSTLFAKEGEGDKFLEDQKKKKALAGVPTLVMD